MEPMHRVQDDEAGHGMQQYVAGSCLIRSYNNHKGRRRTMKSQLLKISSVLFVVILFSLMSGVVLAKKKHWYVVKDKAGVCRVIEAKTIAGPFKTMAEAEQRKAKVCPKGAGRRTKQLRPTQEQAEPMRRRHRQREETQRQRLMQKQTPQQQQNQPETMGRRQQQREESQQQNLKQKRTQHQQKQAPQQQQQTEKIKGKTQKKSEGAKPSEERVKEKIKELIPSDKKN